MADQAQVRGMETQSLRTTIFLRALIAHAIGLSVTGLLGTIGTSGGFGNGAGAAVFVGAILSIPWFLVLAVVIHFMAKWIQQHTLIFCLVGPAVVCGSWFLIAGPAFLEAVACSTTISSVVFLGIALLNRASLERNA